MKPSDISDHPAEFIRFLKRIFPLEFLEEKNIEQLLIFSEIRKYDIGTTIITQGETDGFIYYLVSGSVRIKKNGKTVAVLRRSGDIFGEMSAIDGSSRSASVYAEEDCVCLSVDIRRLEPIHTTQILAFKYLVYRSLSEVLVVRLRQTTSELILARDEIATLKAPRIK
jgi:CRP-like cAMP-binding protein